MGAQKNRLNLRERERFFAIENKDWNQCVTYPAWKSLNPLTHCTLSSSIFYVFHIDFRRYLLILANKNSLLKLKK